jgi:hypothetical protein
MHKLIIRKKLNALNKLSCSCGYIVFATTGKEIDYLALLHAQKHSKAELEEYIEEDLVNPDARRVKPGRHNGNTNTSDAEGGYGYFS